MRRKLTEEEKAQRRAVREKKAHDDNEAYYNSSDCPPAHRVNHKLLNMHMGVMKAFIELESELIRPDLQAIRQKRTELIDTL